MLHKPQPKCLISLCLLFKASKQEPDNFRKYSHSRSPKFSVDDLVFAFNYATRSKWLPAKVIRNLGNVYSVRTDCGIWATSKPAASSNYCW